MSKNLDLSTLDQLLNSVEPQTSTMSKTASINDERQSARSELAKALDLVKTSFKEVPSASPTQDLQKLASDVADLDSEELKKEAHFYGRAMADAYVQRLSEYDAISNESEKTSESIKEASFDAGFEDGTKYSEYVLGELYGLVPVDHTPDQLDLTKLSEEELEEVNAGYDEGVKYATEQIEGYEEGVKYAAEQIEGYEAGVKQAQEDLQAYSEGEAGEEKTSSDDEYRFNMLSNVNDVLNKVAAGEECDDEEDDEDKEDDEEEGEEKNSFDQSWQAGFNDGAELLVKKANELGSWDFILNI